MNWQFVILCAFLACGTVNAIEVQNCDNDIPSAVAFASEGCDKFPCPLVRGTTSNVNITFRIPADTTTSTIKIEANILGASWFPFPAPDPNTCHNLINSYCPLDENEIVIYHLAIPVVKAYPKLKMTLRIQFLDEEEDVMMCLKVPCAVVDPPSL